MVFVNFPVTDIKKSTAFYEKIGFKKNPDFSDELVSCMIWDKNFFIMLLSRARYKTFIGEKEIADTKSSSSALISFTFANAQSVKDSKLSSSKLSSSHTSQFSSISKSSSSISSST